MDDVSDIAVPLSASELKQPLDSFPRRHLGGSAANGRALLEKLNIGSIEALIDATVPAGIRLARKLNLPDAVGEAEALRELRSMAAANILKRNLIGEGYHGCHTPPVIQRNILENPAWYTAYTPYQAEIAQGRLEALANFQTLITDLTGLDIANASLLDEATAAAEAVAMAVAASKQRGPLAVFADAACHPQTLAVLRTRSEALGIGVLTGCAQTAELPAGVCAVLVQTPDTFGTIHNFTDLARRAHALGALVIVAADPLSLVLREPPGKWGADIVVGSTQRFGVPLGFGGPHAAYMATRESLKRLLPGRLVGLSHDARQKPAYRLALQTREQHIRREKATSNICTAQVLLAVMASMYAIYHGPHGLQAIARRVHQLTRLLQSGLRKLGMHPLQGTFFDTLTIPLPGGERDRWISRALDLGLNLRRLETGVGIALDETVEWADVRLLLTSAGAPEDFDLDALAQETFVTPGSLENRTTPFLTHPVFHNHNTETEMLRYIRSLEAKDISLVHSMIPLGSCTMKLNATSEMLPVSWPEFAQMHPFCPPEQAAGYTRMIRQLEAWLAEITGFSAVCLEPNAGSQGEYAGLLVIRAYHRARGDADRRVCLIPTSARGHRALQAGRRH
jgi:glycine dehydrogenase